MPKKGVTKDEKRTRAMQYFFEKKEPFMLKDLERDLPKSKGIIGQAVPDLIKELMDDNLVDMDKIGGSNFYWAFPSKAAKARETKIAKLTADLEAEEQKEQSLTQKRKSAGVGREDGDERRAKLARFHALSKEHAALKVELSAYAEVDPERMSELKSKLAKVKEAANRWTDNVMVLKKSFQARDSSLSNEVFFRRLELPLDCDNFD